MDQQLDSNTLAAFNRQDPQAFKVVFELLYPEVRYLIEKYVEDPETAQDLTSDTFLTLYNNSANFTSLGHIKGYLLTTARWKSLDFLRRRKRKQAREKILDIEEIGEVSDDDSNFENYLIEGGVIAKIYEAVEKLPAECKKIFKLIFYQGLEQTEVANLLEISVSTVRSQKSRALQLLRDSLSGDHYTLLFFVSFSYLARH